MAGSKSESERLELARESVNRLQRAARAYVRDPETSATLVAEAFSLVNAFRRIGMRQPHQYEVLKSATSQAIDKSIADSPSI